MKLLTAIVAAGAIAPAVAMPTTILTTNSSIATSTTCTNPHKRIEWRKLTSDQQQSYMSAVQCLKTKPSRLGLSSSLYDDFPYVHFNLNSYIHGGAPFLPWHRYFTHIFFEALRTDCGYTGPGTYWDWTLDTAGLRFSPVMSAENGFGGDGSYTRTEIGPDGREHLCVNDGPFKDFRPAYLGVSPTELTSDPNGHCMFRNLAENSEPNAFAMMVPSFSPEGIAELQRSGNWTHYHSANEGGPHGVIHASLGGEMNPTTSPNEVLFFLHHSQIDRLWWLWQKKDWAMRKAEYSGVAKHDGEEGSREVKLDDLLTMRGLAADVKVEDIMDIRGGLLCYEIDDE